ncbi:MAG: hypothetical protein RLN76_04510 [Phycisphaeraceae bacterium]
MPIVRSAAIGLLLLCGSTSLCLAQNGFYGIGDLEGGDTRSTINGLSGDGRTAVGSSEGPSGTQAVRWTLKNGLETFLSTTDAATSIATAASHDGSVIVGRANTSAYRWSSTDGVHTMNLLGGSNSSAQDVSGDGRTVVGISSTRAFKWTSETGAIELDDGNGNRLSAAARAVSFDGSIIAGGVNPSQSQGPVYWDADLKLHPLDLSERPERGNTLGMTDDGSLYVGSSEGSFGIAFTSTPDGGLSRLPRTRSDTRATDVSADGSIIVGYDPNGAIIWLDRSLYRMDAWLESQHNLDLQGWQLSSVSAISNDGTVFAGQGFNPQGNLEGWVAIIPTPTSATLLALAAPILLRRR